MTARWVATLVSVLHMAFVGFMIWAPFSSNRAALVMHLVLTPFLWIHWVLNDDTCVLTALERKLRGLSDDSSSFFYKVVSPIYKISDEHVRLACWLASAALWLVTASKVSWPDVKAVLGFTS